MAIYAVKKKRGTEVTNYPIKMVNLNRETVASVSAKLRTALAEIEKLKERLSALEEKVEELESD
jgi:hypothetical protein